MFRSIIIQTSYIFVDSAMRKQFIVTVLYTRLFLIQCKIKLMVSVKQQVIYQLHCYTCSALPTEALLDNLVRL